MTPDGPTGREAWDDDPVWDDLNEHEVNAYDPIANDPTWALAAHASPRVVARRRRVLAHMGRAVLRLRLFLGWTQLQLEEASGVDQTSISRFERGDQQGMSIYRLAALLEALGVASVDFRPPPGPTPTPLELMLYGDAWDRAGRAADRRLARDRRPRHRGRRRPAR